MKANTEWYFLLEQKIINDEMLHSCIYSVSKRAKNCRDKRDFYARKKNYAAAINYAEAEYEYYDVKEYFLTSLLTPVDIDIYYLDNGKIEFRPIYRTAYSTYHGRNSNRTKEDFLNGIRRALRNGTYKFNTYYSCGKDINELVSMQFVSKVFDLVKSGDFTYTPETGEHKSYTSFINGDKRYPYQRPTGKPRGPKSKLSEEEKEEIREMYSTMDTTYVEIATIYKVCPATVANIICQGYRKCAA